MGVDRLSADIGCERDRRVALAIQASDLSPFPDPDFACHLASPRIYTSDVLGAEFIRLRDVFDDMEGIQHLYKLMLEQDEQAERKRTKRDPLADMFPRFRHSERDEIAARYLASQKAFWTALDEFRLIFVRLS